MGESRRRRIEAARRAGLTIVHGGKDDPRPPRFHRLTLDLPQEFYDAVVMFHAARPEALRHTALQTAFLGLMHLGFQHAIQKVEMSPDDPVIL